MCECPGCVEEQRRSGTKVPTKTIKVRKLSMGGSFVETHEEVTDV